MWTAFGVLFGLVAGFICGLIFGPNFIEEFDNFKILLISELRKLHDKLDAILSAVKK